MIFKVRQTFGFESSQLIRVRDQRMREWRDFVKNTKIKKSVDRCQSCSTCLLCTTSANLLPMILKPSDALLYIISKSNASPLLGCVPSERTDRAPGHQPRVPLKTGTTAKVATTALHNQSWLLSPHTLHQPLWYPMAIKRTIIGQLPHKTSDRWLSGELVRTSLN